MTKTPVLYDGDMGGDDLWALALLLAHKHRFDVRGISTVFGNVSQPMAAHNAANFLHWLGEDGIPVVEGANTPCDGMRPFVDDAYGEDGVGGVILPESPISPKKVDIADWLNTQLNAQEGKTLVFATGPATNLALLAEKYPESLKKIREIIFMGGAIEPPGKDGVPYPMENGENRVGNITPYAEFNVYQDPRALNILIEHDAPLTIMAADATQHMVLTPARQERIKALHETYGPAFHRMLMAVDELDRTKFGVTGPFIHDPNVVTYALNPDLYEKTMRTGGLHFREEDPRGPNGDHRGAIELTTHFSRTLWISGVPNTDRVFNLMERSLAKTISAAPARNPALIAG